MLICSCIVDAFRKGCYGDVTGRTSYVRQKARASIPPPIIQLLFFSVRSTGHLRVGLQSWFVVSDFTSFSRHALLISLIASPVKPCVWPCGLLRGTCKRLNVTWLWSCAPVAHINTLSCPVSCVKLSQAFFFFFFRSLFHSFVDNSHHYLAYHAWRSRPRYDY